jgi:hypothetical protein
MQTNHEEHESGYFGLCPICHCTDGYANHGSNHFGVCAAHKKLWYIGSNVFSSWRDDPDATDERFKELFDGYEEVERFSCPECQSANAA